MENKIEIYRVQPHDSLYSVSRKFHVEPYEILYLNQLFCPMLTPGQSLKIPVKQDEFKAKKEDRPESRNIWVAEAGNAREIINNPAAGIELVELSTRTVAYFGSAVPGYLTVRVRTKEPTKGYIQVTGVPVSTKINLSTTEYKTDHVVNWAPFDDVTHQQLPPGEYALKLNLVRQNGTSLPVVDLGKILVVHEPNPRPLIENVKIEPVIYAPKKNGANLLTITFQLNRHADVEARIGESYSGYSFPKQRLAPGTHKLTWNGKDNSGNVMPDGEYRVCFFTRELNYNDIDTASLSNMTCGFKFFIRGGESGLPESRIREVVKDITLSSNVLSPDGDGVNDTITGTVTLSEKAYFSLYIANVLGNHMAVLISYYQAAGGQNIPLAAGTYPFSWDGKTFDGSMIPNGTYYLRSSIYENGQSGYLTYTDKPITVTGSVEVKPAQPIQNVQVINDYTEVDIKIGAQGYLGVKGQVYQIIDYTPVHSSVPTYLVKLIEGVEGYVKVGDVEWIDLDKVPMKWGKVVVQSAAVKKSPGDEQPPIEYLANNTYVRILRNENGWYRVVLSSGKQAYVKASDMIEEAPQPQPPANTILHTVASGDTLWKIAQQYGATVDEIVKLNNLNVNAYLTVGQKLYIPKKQLPPPADNTTNKIIYTIKSGDTLWKIGQTYGVTANEIAIVNRMELNTPLWVGRTLVIPRVYKIASGDVLWKIAQKYNTTVANIAAINYLDPNKPLYIGQRIIVA